jgi:hypothetical protein
MLHKPTYKLTRIAMTKKNSTQSKKFTNKNTRKEKLQTQLEVKYYNLVCYVEHMIQKSRTVRVASHTQALDSCQPQV